LDPYIERAYRDFKAYRLAEGQSSTTPRAQLESLSDGPKGLVRLTTSLIYDASIWPQPALRREQLTAPPMVIAFAKYALRNALRRVTTSEVKAALGVRNKKSLHDAINRLISYGLIARRRRGLYDVNLDVAQGLANAVPQAIGKHDYVALRRYFINGSALGLPSHWAEVIAQRQYWLEALTNASQGTTPSWPAQLAFPVTRLVTPSGRRVPAVDLPDRYIIVGRSLAHRSVVYCAYYRPVFCDGPRCSEPPKPVCSPTLPQLYRYLSPPCPEPYCAPVVPYPVPVAPAKVVGPLADYKGQLIPLSALPLNARKYELGLQAFDREFAGFHDRFNAEVRARQGLIYLTVKSKHEVTEDVLSKALDSVPVMASYYLDKLESVLGALADFARTHTGLNTAELMARANAVLKEALYRKRKPRPAEAPVSLQVKEVRFRAKFKDLRTGEYECRAYRLASLSYAQFMALLGELERVPHRLTYLEVTVVLSDPTGQAVRFLGAGFLFIYHSNRKDPEGAVRVEFRPFKNVTKYVSPQGLALLFYGLVTALAVPIDLAKRALHAPLSPSLPSAAALTPPAPSPPARP